jgi:hypothetical protein
MAQECSGRREDVENDERPGQPVTMKIDENMGKLRILVRTDRRLGIRMTTEEMKMGK